MKDVADGWSHSTHLNPKSLNLKRHIISTNKLRRQPFSLNHRIHKIVLLAVNLKNVYSSKKSIQNKSQQTKDIFQKAIKIMVGMLKKWKKYI